MMVDEYTSTKNPNINKYNGNPVIPLKIKNHNIALPLLTDRIKKNNIKNFEKLFISNILNSSRTIVVEKPSPNRTKFYAFIIHG